MSAVRTHSLGDHKARLFDSALASLRSIERRPGIGSPLVGEMCDIPGPAISHSWFWGTDGSHVVA